MCLKRNYICLRKALRIHVLKVVYHYDNQCTCNSCNSDEFVNSSKYLCTFRSATCMGLINSTSNQILNYMGKVMKLVNSLAILSFAGPIHLIVLKSYKKIIHIYWNSTYISCMLCSDSNADQDLQPNKNKIHLFSFTDFLCIFCNLSFNIHVQCNITLVSFTQCIFVHSIPASYIYFLLINILVYKYDFNDCTLAEKKKKILWPK